MINPSSNLTVKSIKAALVFTIDKERYPTAIGQILPTRPANCDGVSSRPAWRAINEEYLNKIGFNLILKRTPTSFDSAIISTQPLPPNCFDKTSFLMSNEIRNIQLRVYLELEPTSPNPTTNVDRIFQTYSFDYNSNEIVPLVPWGRTPYTYWDDIYYDAYPTSNNTWNINCANPPIITADIFENGLAWTNTFWGTPTNLHLKDQVVTSSMFGLGNIVLGNNVSFGSNPITIHFQGSIYNSLGISIPPNVTFVNSINNPCASLAFGPTDPSNFCNTE